MNSIDDAVIGYIAEKFDEFMRMDADFWREPSRRKRTDKKIEIDNKFDEFISNLKYWGSDVVESSKKQKEAQQKMLKEFGFPESDSRE